MTSPAVSRLTLALAGVVFLSLPLLRAQTPDEQPPAPSAVTGEDSHRARAEAELHEEEQQRILGVMPNFNTSFISDAEPLSAAEKLHLALKGALDPFTFVAAGLDAGMSQGDNDFPSYGQGARGYGKRFSASYLDTFDGSLLGNAVFPILFKQDPRYFRKGTGSFASRLFYAISTSVKCKDDSGKWVPNYSNILGNLAAGGLSNIYYPEEERGFTLTVQRALVVTAEGAAGAIFVEFWPDISRRLFPKRQTEDLLPAGPAAER